MKTSINVAEQAQEFILGILRSGFGGLQPLTIVKESKWHEQYAIFILKFDIPIMDVPDCEYCVNEFDHDGFYSDLLEHVKKSFPRCKVTFNEGTHEYEILGPRFKSFYKKHADKLEDLEMEVSGHAVFKP